MRNLAVNPLPTPPRYSAASCSSRSHYIAGIGVPARRSRPVGSQGSGKRRHCYRTTCRYNPGAVGTAGIRRRILRNRRAQCHCEPTSSGFSHQSAGRWDFEPGAGCQECHDRRAFGGAQTANFLGEEAEEQHVGAPRGHYGRDSRSGKEAQARDLTVNPYCWRFWRSFSALPGTLAGMSLSFAIHASAATSHHTLTPSFLRA